MKKILYIFLCFLYFPYVSANEIICDGWKINQYWKTIEEICVQEEKRIHIKNDIILTGKYTKIIPGFIWEKKWTTKIQIDSNVMPAWYFNDFFQTDIWNTAPEFHYTLWYIWNKNTQNIEWNIQSFLWIFDHYIQTKLVQKNYSYWFPIWFIKNAQIFQNKEINKKKPKNRWVKIYTYWEYIEKLFHEYLYPYYDRRKYRHYEYTYFLNNLITLWFDLWDMDKQKIMSTQDQLRIKWYIENNIQLQNDLQKLAEHMWEINMFFSLETNIFFRKYYIDYILNK